MVELKIFDPFVTLKRKIAEVRTVLQKQGWKQKHF